MLKKYRIESISIDNKSIFNETLNIQSNSNHNVISFEEMSYCNCFSEYTNNVNSKFKGNDSGSFYNISKAKQYIHMLNMNSFKLFSEKDEVVSYSTDKSLKQFLKDNQINNDVDLLNYIKKTII